MLYGFEGLDVDEFGPLLNALMPPICLLNKLMDRNRIPLRMEEPRQREDGSLTVRGTCERGPHILSLSLDLDVPNRHPRCEYRIANPYGSHVALVCMGMQRRWIHERERGLPDPAFDRMVGRTGFSYGSLFEEIDETVARGRATRMTMGFLTLGC